jgi:hypothetical protein
MASISPITDAISAPPSTSLVLPPSNQASGSLATAQTEQTPASSAATAAGQTQTTTLSASSTGSVDQTTVQSLDLVFDALATAGLDTAIDQTLLTPPTAQASGTFSIFMDQLLTAIAAQQAASAQAQAAAAATANSLTAAAATAEFAGNAASATANSALEGNVQELANQSQAANTSTATTAASTNTLTPLQQSFDEFVASAGGSSTAASLPTFLQALATNLHTVPSPLGNLVNSLS